MDKPLLSQREIFNMNFGFLGIQIGYALQNGNVSRILQNMGVDVGQLNYFWLAAPIAGLIIQPIVGLFSDKVWTPLGRRTPFILLGAIMACLALVLMPNAALMSHLLPPLIFAIALLLFVDISFNITMQPFRSLIADMLGEQQLTRGYAVQTLLINIGSVIGYLLPFLLANIFGVSNFTTSHSDAPPSIVYSYYIGAAIMLLSVSLTTLRTREYPPAEFAKYCSVNNANGDPSAQKKTNIITLLQNAPAIMWRLSIIQFFSWGAFFLLWVYAVPAISKSTWSTYLVDSAAYGDAGDWVGVLFAVYSFAAAIFAIFMTKLSHIFGSKRLYAAALFCGSVGLFAITIVSNKWLLITPMIAVGIAWAAISAMPYAILSRALPSDRMGLYMGLFNLSITLPQITIGLLSGVVVSNLFNRNATYMIGASSLFMLLASLAALTLKSKERQLQ